MKTKDRILKVLQTSTFDLTAESLMKRTGLCRAYLYEKLQILMREGKVKRYRKSRWVYFKIREEQC